MTSDDTTNPSGQPNPTDRPAGDPVARDEAAGDRASTSQPEQPATDAQAARDASRGAELPTNLDAEVDAAMAQLGLGAAQASPAEVKAAARDAVVPTTGAAPARAKPRVVQGGREHRTGAVVSVGPSDVFIEFGPKELGVVDRQQFAAESDLPKVGDSMEVVVDRFESGDSIYVCSVPGKVQKAEWEMLQPGDTVEAMVTGTNKGGLEMEIAQHRAFMPASQASIDHVPDLSVFVGQKMTCRVQRIDRRGSGNIVLSRRDLLAEERAEKAESLKGTLKKGDTVEGTVRKIMPFGAFVDLGGIDGLVHISDLSHDRVNQGEKNVAKFVEAGQKVRVQVLKLDWDKNRISLGMKQLQADPFTQAASEIVEGAEVSGRVVRLADFGAFIEVAPGVEGLCHISEMAHRRIGHPSDVLKEDEVVQVKVLKVDASDRRISLSIKALQEAPKREGGGRGRGRGDRDDRDPAEILKETPQLRRMREKAQQKGKRGGGGLGDVGGLGMGLGDLKL